jgi:SAM-dependent methyltransferase
MSVEAFAERVVADLAGTMTTVLCALGDRTGLFRELAGGAATSAELATAAGLSERYVREWASGLYAAGYLDHDPESDRFSLSPDRAAVLADEGGPAFLAGAHAVVRGMVGQLDRVEHGLRTGAGIPAADYGERFWRDVARLSRPDFDHRLMAEWLPAVPGLVERLAAGAEVVDIGCGAGLAAIRLAEAFPAGTVAGIDPIQSNVDQARAAARAAGVEGRVRFERGDAVAGLAGPVDVITIFGEVHDAHDPLGLLRAARAGLRPDGVCLIQEIACGERLADNQGPAATVLYGLSLLHCLPQSIAAGGPALGTCGLPESRLRDLCVAAGFSEVRLVAPGPLDNLYCVRP